VTHPYSDLPNENFWRKFVSNTCWRDLNFNNKTKFHLKDDYKIITAGSCFAQNISRYMKKVGLSVFNAEPEHPLMAEFGLENDSYNQFSARYGNIYTSRQCLELVLQALGNSPMIEDFIEENGRWYDLLRPSIQKNGFSSLNEAKADRRYHLSRVKSMLLEADVFIFTLGLTESWFHKEKGHIYPACPGTVRGKFNSDIYHFRNLNYNEIMDDMVKIINTIHAVNPNLKIILTVSPIPLVATRTSQNVLCASSYSKSVLRSVVGDLDNLYDNVAYFPSYEIINSVCSFGQYLSSDLRDVTERGVSHVMDCFLSSFYNELPKNFPEKKSVDHLTKKFMPPIECEEIFNFYIPNNG
jgi:hypothetical protein